jgi:septal ring-binding cell division protein DamX
MKKIKDALAVLALALALVLLLPYALDAAGELLDRIPPSQAQQQITVQVVMPTAVPQPQPQQDINESLLTAVAQPETAVPATPTATANRHQLTAERAAACQAGRDAGRRLPPYCRATPDPDATPGWGR